MQYSVPYVSQYADIGDHEWRSRGCGIASLKMVMDFWHARDRRNRTAPLPELLGVGLDAGAYREGVGWLHRGLVAVATTYGYDGSNKDWADNGPTPKTADAAWDALAEALAHGPLLASVWSGLDPARGGGHIVVVDGWDGQLVSLADPEEMSEREGRKLMARAPFLKGFKKRAIIVRPKGSAESLP
jgi:hypothetical protein